jgi:hypothetical protein
MLYRCVSCGVVYYFNNGNDLPSCFTVRRGALQVDSNRCNGTLVPITITANTCEVSSMGGECVTIETDVYVNSEDE